MLFSVLVVETKIWEVLSKIMDDLGLNNKSDEEKQEYLHGFIEDKDKAEAYVDFALHQRNMDWDKLNNLNPEDFSPKFQWIIDMKERSVKVINIRES